MSEGITYKPDGMTLWKYLTSTSSLVCIQGPVRSGKSVASIIRIYHAMMSVPITQGKRRSRWLVVRNSYPDLQQSTIKTWLEWFPEKIYGEFKWTPPYKHLMRFGDVEAEVVFESFAGEEDIPSLKSREYTGIWVNEAQFYSRKMIIALYERTGWFPIPGGPKFLQLDMNAPPLGHWVPMMRGDTPIPEEMTENERMALRKPDNWEFLVQPPWFIEKKDEQGTVQKYVINPDAENLQIVGERAVYELLEGRTKAEIDADLMNRVTILTKGKPVFPMFSLDAHVAKAPLTPAEGITLDVGLDFGRTPAAAIFQCVSGRWFGLAELLGDNMGAVTFAPIFKRFMATHFPGFQFRLWGDPAGGYKGEQSEQTAFEIFKAHGLPVRAADTGNRRRIRVETATDIMGRMVHGQSGLLLSTTMPALTVAWAGGYVYRRKTVSGAPIYEEEPHKNEHSHISDAALEVFMGAGESRATLGRTEKREIIRTLPRTDVFGRPLKTAGGRR